MIGAALADLSPGRWLSVGEFGRYMRGAGLDFEVSRDAWSLYIVDSEYGSLGYEGVPYWAIVNQRYLMAVLFEYAATLGLIDLAYVYPDQVKQDFGDLWGTDDLRYLSRYDGLSYFRLNALGAYILGQTKRYEAKGALAAGRLDYGSEGVVRDPDGSLLPADRLFLARFAKLKERGVWEITRASSSSCPTTRRPRGAG